MSYSRFDTSGFVPKVRPANQALIHSIEKIIVSDGASTPIKTTGKILKTIQAELNRQHDAFIQKVAVMYLTGIFKKIRDHIRGDAVDAECYASCFHELFDSIALRGPDASPWKDARLSKYEALDPENMDYRNPDTGRFVCASLDFIKAQAVAGNHRDAVQWVRRVDDLLDNMDGDFFGTEGQLDPRGDRRDD